MAAVLINKKMKAEPIIHFWSRCVGAGRANEGLRANWLEHLKLAIDECGFKYIRFHGLFNEDMFVYRIIDGKEIYNWQYVDELFDRLIDMGIRPFVELGFSPYDMASGQQTIFWWKGNVTPPADYGKWEQLVYKAINHWIERYGLEEVRKWYFEVWNEPNLEAFWTGTKSQYFELYRVTALTIKTIDPGLKVGGPATSNFVLDDRFAREKEDFSKHADTAGDLDKAGYKAVWIEDFINFCASKKLPVDFVSTHPYPTDFALDGNGEYRGLSRSVNSTRDDLKWLHDFIKKSPYPEAEIHLTEWSSSPSSEDCSHDYLPEAAFIVKANIDSTGLADSLSYWTFTDVFEESGAGSSVFHGGFGLINFQGIVKPAFHAYRFLNMLGDTEISRGKGYIATKVEKTGGLSILAYNYPEEEVPQAVPVSYYPDRSIAEAIQAKGSILELSFTIRELPSEARFIIETVDEDHGFAIKSWKQMGMPDPVDRQQIRELRKAGFDTKKEFVYADKEGSIGISLKLTPWSIVSIREC